jgi:DNA-binding NtrC family response regulator
VPLRAEVRAGRFREDLYYRLGLVTLTLPPLRERLDDLPMLTDIFLARLGRDMRREARSVAPAALAVLQRHAWPGNVRELRSVLERALVLQVGIALQASDLPPEVRGLDEAEEPRTLHPVALPEAGVDLGAMERGLVLQALGRARWDTHAAAGMLGLSVDELLARMVRHDLARPVEEDARAVERSRHEARGASVIALNDGRARRATN